MQPVPLHTKEMILLPLALHVSSRNLPHIIIIRRFTDSGIEITKQYYLSPFPETKYVFLKPGEGFSPLGETGPPKGEEAALPTTLSGLGSADGSCPRSLLDLRGWGVLWGRGFEEAILVQTTVVEGENKNNKR